MWRFVLPIENNKKLLQEYGRAVALITNVEYWLKDLIKNRSGETEEKELGGLIEDAKPYLHKNIYNRLKTLNKKRIIIIHGTVIRIGKSKDRRETDKIVKIDKNTKKEEVFPLNVTSLKQISESARKLIRVLIDIRLR